MDLQRIILKFGLKPQWAEMVSSVQVLEPTENLRITRNERLHLVVRCKPGTALRVLVDISENGGFQFCCIVRAKSRCRLRNLEVYSARHRIAYIYAHTLFIKDKRCRSSPVQADTMVLKPRSSLIIELNASISSSV